jgi:hypothetical protein
VSKFSNNALPAGIGGLAFNADATGVVRLPLNAGNINNPLGNFSNNIDVGSSDWTSVHIAPAGASIDEVYLWACRDPQYASADPVTLYIAGGFWAVFNSPEIKVSLASGTGLQLVCPGIPIGGAYPIVSEIKAKGTDFVNIFGFVVRRYKNDPQSLMAGYDGAD